MIPQFPKYIFIDDSTLSRANVNNVRRSEMEVGPQKTAPIQSIPLFNVSMEISFEVKKLADFRRWFLNDIGSGAYWFSLKDPFDGTLRRFRFAENEFSLSKAGNLFRTSIILEAYDEL